MTIAVPEFPALFLDFDGTLVEIAATPEGVDVPPQLPALLERLRDRLGGAVAAITGRNIGSLDAILGMHHLAVAGSHGAEWRGADGVVHHLGERQPEYLAAAERLLAFAQEHGLLVEDKHHSVALHFRQQPEKQAVIDRWLEREIAPEPALRLIRGKCIREVQSTGMDKGKAVERFMQEKPFVGRQPVYIGDDTTDEDAFGWVNGQGGLSIKVGEGSTLAQQRLRDFREVLAFLDTW